MQVDMADEGENKADGTTPHSGEQSPRPTVKREQSEWTASDTRGPLSSADARAAGDEPPIDEPSPEARPAPLHEDASPHAAVAEPAYEPSHEPVPEPSHEPAHEPSHEPTSGQAVDSVASEEKRKSLPAVPIALAVIIGAIIGAGSAAAINVLGGATGSASSQIASLDARIAALEKRPDLQPQIDALKSVDAPKSDGGAAKTPAFDPAPLQQKIADLRSQLDGLKQKDGSGALDSKVAALGGSVDELKAQGATVKDLGGKVAALAATLDGLKKEDATAQAGLASLQAGQKSLEAKIASTLTSAPALAVVADSLVAAVAHGRPYASQVAALGSLGADSTKVAVLKENADKGVPSAQVLAQKFAPLADSIIAAANKPPPNAGIMDRLKSGMAAMVTVRSAGAADGDDAGSRVSRIEADLAHDDVDGAYATWDGLPADAKTKTEAWGALAKTHVEAMDAARALQQQAIAALGGRKS